MFETNKNVNILAEIHKVVWSNENMPNRLKKNVQKILANVIPYDPVLLAI